MTITDITNQLPEGSRCLWQFTPQELPKNAPLMALELWMVPSEGLVPKLVLFQLFPADRKRDWYNRVNGFVRFEQAAAEVAS